MTVNKTGAMLLTLSLGGCGWVLPQQGDGGDAPAQMWIQSALVTAGPHASATATLTWIMFGGAALILLLVVAFTALAIVGGHRRNWMGNRAFVIGFGIAFPVTVLTALLIYGFIVGRQTLGHDPARLRIEVVGERWWWRVRYLDASGSIRLATANEIRIPTGQQIEFVLKTEDVIHSFWVPSLAGKLDMIPGHVNSYRFSAERPGVYRGQCAEYCGDQHALMAFYVVAMSGPQFDAWFEEQSRPAAEPVTTLSQRGRDLFLANGCGACHRVRGTTADGRIGPDLTHIGSRLSLAAGTFSNNTGTLAGWISSSQHLKPGNLMPSFSNLRGEELRAIATYLEGLK